MISWWLIIKILFRLFQASAVSLTTLSVDIKENDKLFLPWTLIVYKSHQLSFRCKIMQMSSLNVAHQLRLWHGAVAERAIWSTCHVGFQRVGPHTLVCKAFRATQLTRVREWATRHGLLLKKQLQFPICHSGCICKLFKLKLM